jgi:hypothetical protein
VLLPGDVVDLVLAWLHEHEKLEAVRLEALISQYGLSARAHGIQLPPSYNTLLLSSISAQVFLPLVD